MLPEHGPSTRHVFFPDEPETCTSRAAASATGEQSGDARRARPGEMDPLSLFPEEEALLTTFPEEEAALTTGPHRPLVVNGAMAVRIQERAADTLAQLEGARTAFEVERKRFESGMVEVGRLGELVSALEVRIGMLTEPDQPLARTDAIAARLEERAADTMAQLERAAAAFDAQRHRFESGMAEASLIHELASDLEARIGTLTDPLASGEAAANRLQERAADTSAQLERIIAAFEAEKGRFESGVVDVSRLGELVSALEARIGTLTEPDQPLARIEATAGRLQERAVDTMAQLERAATAFEAQRSRFESGLGEASRIGDLVSALEARIGTLTEPGQPLARTEAIAGRLQERAVDTMAQLERIVAAFDAEQKRYESGTVEVGRIDELMSALETRSRKLTEPDQPLARGEAMLGRLQQHAVDTKVQLEAMTAAFKAQKNTIASGLAEAARLAKIVSDLEERIAQLTEKGQSLGHAGELVGRLEQRAVKTTAKLEQVTKATGKLGDDLAWLQNAVRTAAESTRTCVEELGGRTEGRRFVQWLRSLKPRAVGGAIVGTLTLLAVSGVMVARAQRGPIQRSLASRPAQRAVSPGSSPVLPSRAFDFPADATQMPTARSTIATKNRLLAARFTKTPPRRSESLTPAAIESARGTSGTNVPAVQRTRIAKPAADLVQPSVFTGDLLVESSPERAAVFIDRQYVGETPLQLTKMRAGSHLVRIERNGHQRWTAAVVVTTDKKVQVSATLQPER